jgi:hypothetical protein
MLGYTHGQQAYQLLDLKQQTIISSQHVIFDEDSTFTGDELAPWILNLSNGQWEGLSNWLGQTPENTIDEGDDDKELPRPNSEAVGGQIKEQPVLQQIERQAPEL